MTSSRIYSENMKEPIESISTRYSKEEVEKYTVTKPNIEEKEGSSAIYAKMYGSEE